MILIFILIFSISLSADHQSETESLIEEGERLQSEGRYEEAVSAFKKVFEKDRYNSTALFNLGLIYGTHLKDRELKNYYWNRYKASTHISIGFAAFESGDMGEALEHYQEALGYMPDDGELHERVGLIYEGQGREEDALREFRKAADLQVDNQKPHLRLWRYFASRGKVEEAESHFADAEAAGPLPPEDTREALGYYKKLGRDDKVIDCLSALSEGGNATEEEHLSLGRYYLDRGKPDLAMSELRKGLSDETRAGVLEAAARLAKVYEGRDKPLKAAEVYKGMMSAGCSDPSAPNSLMLIYHKLGRYEDAIKAGEKGIRLFSGNPALHNNLATVYALNHSFKKAVEHYRRAVRYDPNLAEAYLDMGIIYRQHLDKPDKAREVLEMYVKLRPEGRNLPEVIGILGTEDQVEGSGEEHQEIMGTNENEMEDPE